MDNPIELLLLQHPLEQHEAKGTAALLRLSLARCKVLVGEQFDAAALGDLSHTALLYPGNDPPPSAAATQPSRLIVIDATWRKSRQMLARNPLLQSLPRLALRGLPINQPNATNAVYAALRKARLAEHLSTLEASVLALQQLEPQPERYAPLLSAFGGFVAEQVGRRGGR